MASKAKTPSFVVELPLVTSAHDERLLAATFEAGGRLANVMIQHGRKVLAAMRAAPQWVVARVLARATQEQRGMRAAAFAAVREGHGFTQSAFDWAAVAHKNAAGFAERLGTHVAQKIAQNAFAAFAQHLLGVRGRPRFKGGR